MQAGSNDIVLKTQTYLEQKAAGNVSPNNKICH